MDTGTLDLDLFVGREFASYKDLQDVLDAKKAAFGDRWEVAFNWIENIVTIYIYVTYNLQINYIIFKIHSGSANG